jgi:16S rRNA (adenine1518-N6/adenine1519-N6)-dimethyltransferase
MRPSTGRGRGGRPPTRAPPAGRAGRAGRGRRAPEAPPPPPDTPTLAATKQFLKDAGGDGGARPKKALGQNFVIDPSVLDAVAAAPGLTPGQGVLEVGPGTGNLTGRLLATGAAVTAVEKDDALFAQLAATLGAAHPHALRLVHGDVLRVHVPDELAALKERAGAGGGGAPPSPSPRLCVVANLPYNITGDALRLFLPLGGVVSDVYLMLQAEAAERYATATPSSHAWRGATVLARHYADIDLLERIPAAAFLPAPRVNSALVRFRLRAPADRAPLADDRLFKAVVVAAFNQRRKALRNSIATVVGGPEAAAAVVAAAGLGVDTRADAVDVPGFVALANAAAAMRDSDG